ncbi:MAG TPA: galactokinase [Gaiellaceae bacterium]|nr:galactokinase [Gaiellaceae bacterium]
MPDGGDGRGFRAPGRVNLIGEHTDYNEGFVLPIAIDLECVVRVGRAGGDRVRLRSTQLGGEVELPADGSAEPALTRPAWGRYAAGVVRVLAELGRPAVGFEGEVSSTVPIAAGLSSSAAFEVAVALALCDAAGFEPPPLELAQACQRGELVATGVPCGIMDQLTSIAGRRGSALLIDCRSLDVDPIPLPPGLAVLVVHSGVPRELAGSAYAERRRECEEAAARLGLRALRDATLDQVAGWPRARHVVSENARVNAAVEALRAGDAARLGGLLGEGHASLRDDFEVSTPELDTLVELLVEAGALGARLTGAGFGGCVVALASTDRALEVGEAAAVRYRAETGREPRVFVCRAADGAGPVAT